MKLPFDFGARFVLRLLFPGTILASALYPLAITLKGIIYPALANTTLFVGVGLICGFGFLLLDMPIYMFMEGRRFWPNWLRKAGIRSQASRLRRLQLESAKETDSARQVELDVRIAQYPIDGVTGDAIAVFPTRLGNLLASFETYPTVKYGLDGVFFWPRLWVAIDKDLRDELDSAQAIVDGAIYLCVALVISSFLCLAYGFLPVMQPTDWRWVFLAAGLMVGAIIAYRSAIFRYAQYGELFSAVFDQHRGELKLDSILHDLDSHMGAAVTPSRSEREQNMAAWRFLRWHRYRSASGVNETVKNWRG